MKLLRKRVIDITDDVTEEAMNRAAALLAAVGASPLDEERQAVLELGIELGYRATVKILVGLGAVPGDLNAIRKGEEKYLALLREAVQS